MAGGATDLTGQGEGNDEELVEHVAPEGAGEEPAWAERVP